MNIISIDLYSSSGGEGVWGAWFLFFDKYNDVYFKMSFYKLNSAPSSYQVFTCLNTINITRQFGSALLYANTNLFPLLFWLSLSQVGRDENLITRLLGSLKCVQDIPLTK